MPPFPQSQFVASIIRRVNNFTVTIASGATSGSVSLPAILEAGFASIHWLGSWSTAGTMQFTNCGTNATIVNTVSATASVFTAAPANITVTGQRIDWDPRYVKTVQAINVIVSGVTSASSTLGTAVSAANSFILYAGNLGDQTDRDYGKYDCTLSLTGGGTTVTATRVETIGTARPFAYVIECYPGVISSVQEVEATIASGNTSATGACSATTINNVLCLWYGSRTTTTTSDFVQTRVTYTGGTTITATRGSALALSSTARVGIIQFNPGFLYSPGQQALVGDTGSTIGTSTISKVDLDKTVIGYLGEVAAENNLGMGPGHCALTLQDNVTLRTDRGTLGTTSLSTTVSANVLSFI